MKQHYLKEHWEDLIVGHQPSSYCDWPGKISTVLFTSGCDLFCPTCHNKSIAHPKEDLSIIPLDTIQEFLLKKQPWIDGVVITGGEPLIHDNLIDFLSVFKKFNYPIKLDTNGMHPYALYQLLERQLIDTVAMDIKAPFEFYPEVTGRADIDPLDFKAAITECISIIRSFPKVNLYFRTTLVPLINNTEMLEEIKSYIPSGYRHRIQSYIAR